MTEIDAKTPPVIPASSTADPLNNSLDTMLSGMVSDNEKPAPVSQPEKNADEKSVVVPQKTTPEKTTNVEKKVEEPSKQPEKKVESQKSPEKAATLREAKERAENDLKSARAELEKLKKDVSAPKDDPEKKALVAEIESHKKKLADVEGKLKLTSVDHDPEFQKSKKLFSSSYESAKKDVSGMTIKEPDKKDEFGSVVEEGKMRKATSEDWDKLMSISDEDEANKFISEKFGYNASKVTLLRDRVLGNYNSMLSAQDDFKNNFQAREASRLASEVENRTLTQKMFSEHRAAGVEKYPNLFKPIEGDDKGNAMLNEGMALAELAFGVLPPEKIDTLPKWIQGKMVDGQLPPNEQIALHSAVLNMAGGFNRSEFKNRQLVKENIELKKSLEAYEESTPEKGEQRHVESSKVKDNSAFAMIDRMAQPAT